MDETHEVHLTERGRRIAGETCERHNTFRQLLTGLGVNEKTAARDACQMKHAVFRVRQLGKPGCFFCPADVPR